MLKFSNNTLDTWSKTQATVALRGGEAEFVAMRHGVVEPLAARSFLSEVFGKQFKIVVHTDSSATRAMALRMGPGRVKHMDFWIFCSFRSWWQLRSWRCGGLTP